jgi:PKD repeat protein
VICPSFSHINLTAYFTANATDIDGTITSYRWDFGDGTVRTNANHIPYEWHTYTTAGEYLVTLTVTDDDGQQSSTSGCPAAVETTTVPTGSAPTGTITIDDGAVYTTNTQGQVTLKLTAADADGDLAEMQFSVDGVNFGAAEDFDTTTYYTLVGPEGDKAVWVRYIDAMGNLSPEYSASIKWDKTPPPAPTGLTASRTKSKKSVTLEWNAVAASDAPDLAGYRVFRRATTASVFTPIVCEPQGGGTATECTDGTVDSGTSYEYYVKAYDSAGNESAQSNVAGPV